MNKRIIAVHLLNDRSGSPLIFRQALEVLAKNHAIALYTATPSGDGFLSNIPGVDTHPLFYKWHPKKLFTLYYFLLCQWLLFWKLLVELKQGDKLYINTLLPFGAALAGKIRGVSIIYHLHETSLKPALLKKWLFYIANHTATKVMMVSGYVAAHYRFSKAKTEIVYNALSPAFIHSTKHIATVNMNYPFTVAMICSLKAYKGVYHFLSIARKLPRIKFVLVLNAPQKEVDLFIAENNPGSNCSIYAKQEDTVPFYQQAHVVMNLSKPEGWVETFGMTLLEAMHCGRPVICPAVGGVLELVENGVQGFTICSSQEDRIIAALLKLSGDIKNYIAMSEAARLKAATFEHKNFATAITDCFGGNSEFQNRNKKRVDFPDYGNILVPETQTNN